MRTFEVSWYEPNEDKVKNVTLEERRLSEFVATVLEAEYNVRQVIIDLVVVREPA